MPTRSAGMRRQLWSALAFLAVAAVGITATVFLASPDVLDQPWGIPAITATGGLAGGALAGGITQLVLYIRAVTKAQDDTVHQDRRTPESV